jgi:uncharacterized protein YndB with AHSA1/START domain
MIDIDSFKPDTVYTIYIASTPEKIWQALTTAEFSRQYFFGFAFEMDSKVGGPFIVRARLTVRPISTAKCSRAIRREDCP